MPRTTPSSPMWHREHTIDREIRLASKLKQVQFRRFVTQVETRDRYYQLAAISDIAALSQVDELQNVPDATFETPFASTITPLSYKGKFKVSIEAFKRDPYGIYDGIPTMLSDAINKAKEQDCAGFLMRPDDAGFVTTPDGVALASASHIYSLGVFSNILEGEPPLSYSSSMAMILMMMQQPDYNGDNMQQEGPFQILVPVAQKAIAENIRNTMNGSSGRMRYDTTDHEPNWVGDQISSVQVVSQSTDQLAWGMQIADRKPLLMVNGLNVETIYERKGDDASDNWTVINMYALGADLPQAFGWSGGAGG